VGAPFRRHAARLAETEEALQLIRSYWAESQTTFNGRYYQAKAVTLEPKPVQRPHPPFFLGGGSLKVLELTAKYGQGWMPFAPTTSGLLRRLKQLSELLKDQGRTLDELEVMPSILFQLGKSKQDAQKRLPKWAKLTNDNRVILGTALDCFARIQEYREAGATHLALRLVHPEDSEEAIQTIVTEILPNL
jgi:alkanesulfonate monooxygenase SsuD/methylene tetrahydromethanopterin reductase-like flavin-dependent oxidoreductase (luciferase family)